MTQCRKWKREHHDGPVAAVAGRGVAKPRGIEVDADHAADVVDEDSDEQGRCSGAESS